VRKGSAFKSRVRRVVRQPVLPLIIILPSASPPETGLATHRITRDPPSYKRNIEIDSATDKGYRRLSLVRS